MKAIGLKERIQNSITNNSMSLFNGMLDRIFKYPDRVLLTVWLLYAILDFLTVIIASIHFDLTYALVNLVLGFALSYIMYYFLLPRILMKGKVRDVLWILFLVAGITLIKFLIIFSGDLGMVSFRVVWMELLRVFQFQGLTLMIWIPMAYHILLSYTRKMEVDLEQMNVLHKSIQLGPHFVLNMMNEILSKSKVGPGSLFNEIEQFSMVLSYSYKDTKLENSLLDELQAIRAFIYCQRCRFGDKMQFHFGEDVSESRIAEVPFPKMLLLTLLFDVFKHGDYVNDKFPCQVRFEFKEIENDGSELLCFSISNLKGSHFELQNSGFGIKAVIRVLHFYFGEDFRLVYTSTEDEFSLLLTIEYG